MKRYLTTVFAIAAVLSSAAALAENGRGNDGWRNDAPRGNGSQQGWNDNNGNHKGNGNAYGHDKHWDAGRGNGHDQRYRNDGYRPGYANTYRPVYRPAYRPVYRPAPYVRAGYGYPAQPYAYRRGGYAPAVYLQPQYVVRDYRGYGLAPPPPNYYWLQPLDGRYLLIQATTGLIAQALGY